MAARDIDETDRIIVRMIIDGVQDARIAAHLHISLSNLQRRLRRLMANVGAPNRAKLGVIASRRGWIDPD